MIDIYRETPFNAGTLVDYNDVYTQTVLGQTTYALVNKPGVALGGTIQAGNNQFRDFNGGFTRSGNNFTLAAAPAVGEVIIASGVLRAVLKAYDQPTVTGVVGPANVSETKLYFIDPIEIGNFVYEKVSGQPNIKIQFVDKDPANGALASWVELAPNQANNTPGSYNAPGAPMYEREVKNMSNLTANISAGATSIPVANGALFTAGDFIQLDFGFGDQEIVYVQSIAGNTLTTTPTSFAHFNGDTVYHCGWAFWARLTLPTPVDDSPVSFLDCAFDVLVDVISRT